MTCACSRCIWAVGRRGIKLMEYTTAQPQALGKVLERMGCVPVARHRSRAITLLYTGYSIL